MTGPLRLVVAGGGIAGLEALVALQALAPGRVDATLLEPGDTFRQRALDIGEPFGMGRARRYAVADLAAALGATLVTESLHRVDPSARTAILRSGTAVEYDALLLATGARPYPALPAGVLFDPVHGPAALDALAAQPSGHTAVVVPPGVGWTLPAYELALALAGARGTRVTLVTAEHEPLEAFGAPASEMAREELAADGVDLVVAAHAVAHSRTRLELGSGTGLDVDRVVHLPRFVGLGIPGVPSDARGFVLAGDDGAVEGADGLYAAGDGTVAEVKQGGLAAQQAEAAAYAIAARAGATVDRPRGGPVLRGVLRTRRGPRYMVAEPPGGDGVAKVSRHALWWPPTKVASSWLMPWLMSREAHRGAVPARTTPAPREPSFRRDDVTFGAVAGWRVAGAHVGLQDALAKLPGADRDAAIAVHAAALDAVCAEIAALHADAELAHDSRRLGRLARAAAGAHDLAAELAAVRREAGRWAA